MKFFASILLTSIISLHTQSVSSRSAIGGRIIGGQLARAGEFPSSAAVNIHTTDGQYFCGGSLISDRYVLTAAQCCEDALTFTIVLGANNLQGNSSTKITVVTEEYVLNPNYDAFTLQHDIALIRFRLPITFTDYIKPIELPSQELPAYSAVVAIGWGQTSDQDAGNAAYLYRVTITSLSNEECRLTYGGAIIDEMVCAEGNYNEGSCYGDSGSPLIQYVLGVEATHVGVSSFFGGNGCESTDPSGFTRTFSYIDWIKNVTNIP